MISSLKAKLSLYFHPPEKGDVFYADALDFMCERLSERIFYPLIDRHGHTQWNFIPGNNTYRFMVESTAMPYYILNVSILVSSIKNPHEKIWLSRSRERRMWKKDFHRLILEGRMVRTTSQSLYK